MFKGVLLEANTGVAEVEALVDPAGAVGRRATSFLGVPTEGVGKAPRIPQTGQPLGTAAIPGAMALKY